ncbi:MAG TPA: permease-like cell division protein FtsX [Gaiellaceae bacterium]|jgi:cell division transport system permease protein|nr:permease-like cell division protein FtsX [Gaiellaceae bacterium]
MTGRGKLLFAEAWRSLGANLSTTVAATMTVLIGMFLLGLFIALGTWTVSWSNHVKRELVVKVYFKDGTTSAQKTDYARMLQQSPYVKSGGINYVSKEQGLRQMQKQYPELTKNLSGNPLEDRMDVTPNKAENVDKLFDSLTGSAKPAYIDKVNDGKKISHRILQVAHVIEVVFTLATLVLLVASVLLISNTIRLSIFSRRREIEVMKLVGATNWFVRGPFMLEGLLCGLAGSLLAVFFLVIGKAVALPSILPHLSGDSDVHAMAFPLVALALLVTGLGLGAVGSGLTIRRFLQV